MRPAPTTPSEPTGNPSIVQYQVVAARRQSYEEKIWQVPAITLAAQAVLLTAAASENIVRIDRIVAGFLTAGAALIASNLLLRQRRNQEADKAWLSNFEFRRRWASAHKDADLRAKDVKIKTPFLAKPKPHLVWILGMAVFGGLGLAASVCLMLST
ncbi:hypothetical protein SVIO_001470 [Streptomyces violaceusniger]|uniref:Uncharacterized protein n=2 Tax=Streptomyces violaceusniger TaxID=68280 RepID=A0A4D4KMU8_STRVO|nr:hypothetical protein SVIO_001470 [Streptomyces violaceusniger]